MDELALQSVNRLVFCKDCIYWHNGRCHRHSPRLMVAALREVELQQGQWPITSRDECCGEGETRWEGSSG